MPAIDPFTIKNRQLSDREIDERLAHYEIHTDLPLVVQISRLDPWKDPKGVMEAFKLASKQIDARLVLLGDFATDDPEGEEIFQSLCACRDERILILTNGDDTALVNALQTHATVVLQKSLREGFGLTVAEAMWKGTPVIGGSVGGIRYQIDDGVNGFLISSIEETAKRIVQLVDDKELRDEMGHKARETVRKNFLLTRYLEQYLDLFAELYPRRCAPFRPWIPKTRTPQSGVATTFMKPLLTCLRQFVRQCDVRFSLIALQHAIEEPDDKTVRE